MVTVTFVTKDKLKTAPFHRSITVAKALCAFVEVANMIPWPKPEATRQPTTILNQKIAKGVDSSEVDVPAEAVMSMTGKIHTHGFWLHTW